MREVCPVCQLMFELFRQREEQGGSDSSEEEEAEVDVEAEAGSEADSEVEEDSDAGMLTSNSSLTDLRFLVAFPYNDNLPSDLLDQRVKGQVRTMKIQKPPVKA